MAAAIPGIVEGDQRVVQHQRGLGRQRQRGDGQPDGQIQLVGRAGAQRRQGAGYGLAGLPGR